MKDAHTELLNSSVSWSDPYKCTSTSLRGLSVKTPLLAQHRWKTNYSLGFRTLSKCSSAYEGEKTDFKIFFSLLATVTINYLKPKFQEHRILKLLE